MGESQINNKIKNKGKSGGHECPSYTSKIKTDLRVLTPALACNKLDAEAMLQYAGVA